MPPLLEREGGGDCPHPSASRSIPIRMWAVQVHGARIMFTPLPRVVCSKLAYMYMCIPAVSISSLMASYTATSPANTPNPHPAL